jgi:hypothetical protein
MDNTQPDPPTEQHGNSMEDLLRELSRMSPQEGARLLFELLGDCVGMVRLDGLGVEEMKDGRRSQPPAPNGVATLPQGDGGAAVLATPVDATGCPRQSSGRT